MTTVRVPSRTHAGCFYDVTIGIDGTPICSCPASFNHLECWHIKYVKEETVNDTTTALVPIQLAQRNALVPTEREMVGITRAAKLALSGAVALPPELNSPEKVATVMLYGLELGLMPFTAIRHLAIIKGRVSPSAEVMAGLYLKHEPAGSISVVSIDDEQCTMRIIRPSRKIDETYQVTWDEIKKAGLASGNNLQYPKDRMRYHATKRLLRIYAPDIINMLDGPSIEMPDVAASDDDMPLTNEGDTAPVWREEQPVQAPSRPTPPAPSLDELTAAYMDLIDKQGKDAGLAVMDWALESYPHATGKTGKLDKSKLTAEESSALVAEMRRYIRSGQPRCADGAHEPQFNEDTTLMACSVCGLSLEEQPSEPVAAGLGI